MGAAISGPLYLRKKVGASIINSRKEVVQVATIRKFRDPKKVKKLLDDYFKMCKEQKKLPTITRLAVYLGTTRQGLLTYENREDTEAAAEIAELISIAKTRIESGYEDQLFEAAHVQGPIFSLKNNFGWQDKRQIDTNIEGGISVCWADGTTAVQATPAAAAQVATNAVQSAADPLDDLFEDIEGEE